MQDIHYSYIKNEYGPKVEMRLTNTDSLIFIFERENV